MARRKNYINRIHIMIEFAALAVWLASMILAVIGAMTLEGEVPTHFNGRGVADTFGAPTSLLVTPIVLTCLYRHHLSDPDSGAAYLHHLSVDDRRRFPAGECGNRIPDLCRSLHFAGYYCVDRARGAA